MQWFKFYGQDFMTDPKIRRLNPIHQLMWVYLLCLVSNNENGLIEFVNENDLILLCGISPLDEKILLDLTANFFAQLTKMKMIEIIEDKILIINYKKRQEKNLSGAERAKRYRERHANNIIKSDDSNITSRDDSNARLDKTRWRGRLDEIRQDKDINKDSETFPNGNARCPLGNGEAHKNCIQLIDLIAQEKKTKFPNYGKQINALHKSLRVGFKLDDIEDMAAKLISDPFYQEKGWDLMTVANELGKRGQIHA